MTAEATTATAATTTTTATTATTAAAAPWHGLTDPAQVTYVENKGWKSFADTLGSYQGAEKLIGRDPNTLIALPRADDPAGFLGVMDKLGRPATPDKYEFAAPDAGMKVDEKYQQWARGTFHELGLPAQTVKALSAKHNEYVKGMIAQQEKDYQLSVTTDKAALQAEWKDGAERMFSAATAAAKGLGFTPEIMDSLERSMGYAATMKFMAGLGKRMGEDTFVTGGNKGGFGGTTPEEAKNEWDRLKNDPVVLKALQDSTHPDNKKYAAKQKALFAIMYPEK